MRLEVRAAEDGELLRMIGRVGWQADFASDYNAGPPLLGVGMQHGDLALDIGFQSGYSVEPAELVRRLPDVDPKCASLTICR